MEKRIMANVCRGCVITLAFVFTAVVSHAQLLNGGFESGTGGAADNWTQFNGATQTATNDMSLAPASIRAHTGAFSMNTFGPFPAVCCDASGAYQDIGGPVVGQTYKFYGYVLNWSGAPLVTSSGITGFAEAQIVFLDAGSTVITNVDGVHYGADVVLPLDQWQAFQVLATAPANAATMRLYVLHVGMSGATGSAWWDDLAVAAVTGTTNVIASTSQPGVQIAWPTTQGNSYQVQSTTTMSPTNWTNFGPVYPGVGGVKTNNTSDVITTPNKFYKVIQTP